MRNLMAVSFVCALLSGCGGRNLAVSPEELREIKDEARAAAQKSVRQSNYKILNLAEGSARKSAAEAAKQAVQIFFTQDVKETAARVASAAAAKAIQKIERQFASLSESEIEAVKASALEAARAAARESAHAVAEETAKRVASAAAKEIAKHVASAAAEETAARVASAAADKAIQKMERQFASLSKSEIEAVKASVLEAALAAARESAGAAAEETAKRVASAAAKETAAHVASAAAKETAARVASAAAEETAARVASAAAAKAIQKMERQFASLSESEIEAVKASALEAALAAARESAGAAAEETAKRVASAAAKETAKHVASAAAKETAKHVASAAAAKAIQKMERQFASLSESEIKAIKASALEAARTAARESARAAAEETAKRVVSVVAEETAARVASAAADKAIQKMERQFASLSKSEIETVKASALEAALAAARESAGAAAEETAARVAAVSIDTAIHNMERRFSSLLRAGLRTIISAAIEAATAAAMETVDEKAAENAAASEAEGKTALDGESQLHFSAERRFSSLPFEACHWTNQSYTARIIKEHGFFFFSDPLETMRESWEASQGEAGGADKTEEEDFCAESSDGFFHGGEDHLEGKSLDCAPENRDEAADREKILEEEEKEFAYLLPQHGDFILSFFQKSIQDIDLSENDVPLECFFASAVRGASMYNPGKDFYYCEKDANRPGNMSVTDENQKQRVISPRRACLNRNYMYLTARAFNKTADCFGFDKSEKESIFNLFHYESSFLHNIKSPTGAKCYGQLTTDTIKEINKQIYFRDTSNPFPYSYIFDEVINECPGLQAAVLNSEISDSLEKAEGKSMTKFKAIISRSPISCKITQNPYSCLFYAFYNIKKNMVEIKAQFDKPTSRFAAKNNIPPEFKERFFLPISLNEMVGVTNAQGRDMIFWDDSELWGALKNRPLENLSNIRKLRLFEDRKKVMDLFSFWTYNGGISVTLNYMTDFLRQLKRSIAAPCPPDSQTKICQYRFAIGRGEGIATAGIKKDFQAYIRRNYQKSDSSQAASLTPEEKEKREKRRREVTNFVSNVARSISYLHNENSDFKRHLKTLVPDLEEEEIEDFQEHLREVCPKP